MKIIVKIQLVDKALGDIKYDKITDQFESEVDGDKQSFLSLTTSVIGLLGAGVKVDEKPKVQING